MNSQNNTDVYEKGTQAIWTKHKFNDGYSLWFRRALTGADITSEGGEFNVM